MKKLIIFTGLDGCGKSTRFKKLKLRNKELKFLYEPKDWREKSIDELKKMYKEYDVLDRCFLLDEIVYSNVWDEKSKITKEQSLEILESLNKEVTINIGVNTYVEYSFIHKYRGEKEYPEYYTTLKEWVQLVYFLEHYSSKNIIISIFWFGKRLNYREFINFYLHELEGKNHDL